jgi:hypothetical protein
MKKSLIISLMVTLWITVGLSGSRELLPGLHYYGFDQKTDGCVVFLWAQTSNSVIAANSVEHVMALDVDSSKISEICQAPPQSRLFIDYSGKWGGLLYQLADSSMRNELLFFSLQNHATYRASCPSGEIEVAIVGNHAFIKMGRLSHGIVEDHDLLSGRKKVLKLTDSMPIDGEDYCGIYSRVCDARNVYVSYDPHGVDSGLMKGLYAYDIQSGKGSRIGNITDFYDVTSSGTAVLWTPQELGWVLSIHKPNKQGNTCLFEPKGKIIYRDPLQRLNFKQITPCGRYAVFVKTELAFGKGLRTQVYLCALCTGKPTLLLEARAGGEAQAVPLVDPYWLKRNVQTK